MSMAIQKITIKEVHWFYDHVIIHGIEGEELSFPSGQSAWLVAVKPGMTLVRFEDGRYTATTDPDQFEV